MRASGLPTLAFGLALVPRIAIEAGNPFLPYVVAIAVASLAIVGMWLIGERNIGAFLWGRGALRERQETAAEPMESKVARLATAHQLTTRETEVLRLLLEGRSVPFIKESLYLSANTVKTHVRHIYQKVGVHNRQELIDRAL